MSFRMEMVPLLMKEESNEDYEPKVVSFGPYHHGKEKLKFVEDFKFEAVKMFIEDKNENDFMAAILLDIEYARSCYLEEFTKNYTNEEFALMMFRDACVILNYIGQNERNDHTKQDHTIKRLGSVVYSSIRRDMYLLENQVPFRILEILVGLKYGTHREAFVKEMETYFFKIFFNDEMGNIEESVELGKNALHLLEIFRRVIVAGNWCNSYSICICNIDTLLSCCGCEDKGDVASNSKRHRFDLLRSVTDLKSKAIHFRASEIQSLMDVKLRPSVFGLSAELHLPCLYVDIDTRVFFKNVIAFEVSPNIFSIYSQYVTAYVNIMKRFVASKEDVKELRDKGIIINQLESDEQVVQLFKDLNTYGAATDGMFQILMKDIQSHFNSNAKMRIADIKTKYFDNPWTTFALVGSIFFIFLDIVQTYFAAVPPGSTK